MTKAQFGLLCKSHRVRIVNNVLVTRGGGHVFHYVENGTILEDVEVAYFNQGIVPERFRAFGDAPKS